MNLYVKTDYSLLKSLITIDELIKFAREKKMTHLVVTDDNMAYAFEFNEKCLKNNIKPIFGLEIKDKYLLFAKNYQGYQNLIKLSTLKSKKELTNEDLIKYKDNIICIKENNDKEIYDEEYVLKLNPVLYLNEEDKQYLNYLVAIEQNKTVDEIKIDGDYHYVDQIIPDSLYETNVIFPDNLSLMPKLKEDSFVKLKQECIEGMKDIFKNEVSQIYQTRLKEELETIESLGFCDYFLIVADIIKHAKNKGIYVGPGRGSSAGSLVAYVLGITKVDPIEYDLLFERFLNKNRVSLPDIDIDFEDERRNEVIDYVIEKYGKLNVAYINTYSTLAAKAVLRDIFKVASKDNYVVNEVLKNIDPKLSLLDNLDDKLKDILKKHDLEKLYRVAIKISNLKKHSSSHAAGIIISNYNLTNIIPLIYQDGHYKTAFEQKALEKMGFLKIDFLGLKNLTILKTLKEELNIDLDDLKFNDLKTFNLLSQGFTKGLFQLESFGMTKLLKELKPSSFNDIVLAISLYRPGPMDHIKNFIQNKNHQEKIKYLDEVLKDILSPTYGVLIYQEQIMQIAYKVGGLSLAEADILRRAMSKKDDALLAELKPKFLNDGLKKGYDQEDLQKLFDEIFKFANYGFNKSHAVAYAIIAYQMAYIKANYPLMFYKTLLNYNYDVSYFEELKALKIDLLGIDINDSDYKFITNSNSLQMPFSLLKYTLKKDVDQIIKNRPYKDIFDFLQKNKLPRESLEELIILSAFKDLGYNNQTLINNLDKLMNYQEIATEGIFPPILDNFEEYEDNELLLQEYERLGFYVKNHPAAISRIGKDVITLEKIETHFNKFVSLVVLATKINVIKTKENKDMAFVSVSDEFKTMDLVVFPKKIELIKALKVNQVIQIRCLVEKRYDKYQLILDKIIK
jgi:DNA polymerase-3 subunit alpha